MQPPAPTKLRIGNWRIDPVSGQILGNGETTRVETRTMRLLLCLASRAGDVVSIDELLNQVWPDVAVSQDSVYQAITSLRRLLGDDPKQPTYIATVPRLGYRMVAKVSPWEEPPPDSPNLATEPETALRNAPKFGRRRRPGFTGYGFQGAGWAAAAAICVALLMAFLLQRKFAADDRIAAAAQQPQREEKSIAVLPFLDLTQTMNEEPFADGMTEELIDKLSKIPGLRVPSPTSSFYFKGKQLPIADIAKSLSVAYILDGSVRKSGARLRVAARLVRADNGYVIWTETYDRPFHDILMVQDDIAGEVTKALQASIEASPAGK